MLKILLVDDEVDTLNTIALFLQNANANYQLTLANSGKEAFALIKEQTFDIIISDINMDEINGVQLARVANKINPDSRIILISGFLTVIDQIKHFNLGIEKILTKPFEIDELTYIIENPQEKLDVPLSNMIPVRLVSLIEAQKIPVDLYVQLTEKKFIKIFCAKQTVDVPRLKQFLAQNISFLFAKIEEGLKLDLTFYLPARVSIFKSQRIVNFDVFYFKDEEYKKLIPKGALLNEEMLKLIKNFAIKVLYIRDKDHLHLLNYLDQTLDIYMKSKEISTEDKIFTTSSLVQARLQETCLNPTSENILNLKKSQKHLIDFLKEGKNPIKDLLKLNEKDKGIHIHSCMVASLSYALLLEIMAMRDDEEEKLKIRALDEFIFESDEVKEILFTGAILHDVGKAILNINESIFDVSEKESELSKLLSMHPLVAYDKLSTLKVLHPKSLEIILQHEEFCDGSGYPYKLKKNSLSIFSQIVILINYFDKLRRHQDLSAEEAIKQIKKIQGKFNRHLIPVLERVILKK